MGFDKDVLQSDILRSVPILHRPSQVLTTTPRCPLNPGKSMTEKKISLTPLQTKTEVPRVIYILPDLYKVLEEAKRRVRASYPDCSWVCQSKGKPVQESKKSWRGGLPTGWA
jgi:hypothetical protein